MKTGKFIILSGPSGVGKDTLINIVLPELKNFSKVVTATSRMPRQGEINGRDYHYYSKKVFEEKIKKGEFVEYVQTHGTAENTDYYGTPKKELSKLKQGINLILNMEVLGAKKIKKQYPEAVRIFIKPKNLNQLKKQLETRGKESKKQIEKRIARAEFELAQAKEYDYQITNYYDSPDKAATELLQILNNLTN